ncbi:MULTISPECIES: hypothetical protein [unclassified Streptomyces]|uniref:hypothetical protein n=1 Tax=unclassified Streptomyces TaxID=2593676 RepID=UPI0033AEB3D1
MMKVAFSLGLGLAAGTVGTAVLTVSEKIEQRLTGRASSTVPGQVGAAVAGSKDDEVAAQWLNTPVHWAHGTAMGALRGALGLTGLGPVASSVVFYGLVWGGDVVLYRSLGIAPWPWKWRKQELVTDLFHKGVYALATSATFEPLRRATS